MHELINKTFSFLLAVFLFVIYLKNEHYLDFLYFHYIIDYIFLILAIILIVLGVNKVNKRISTFRFTLHIQLISSFLLLLFFTHELFTPYFYTDNYLKKVGVEKIELYHQLSDTEIDSEERDKLAKDAVVKDMAASYSIINQYPTVEPLEKIEVLEFKRNFDEYEMTIKGKHPEQDLVHTYEYTFEKEGLDFKIIGFANLN
ncbi:hypothetical protein [Fredinandcohnia sp. 179-A 10B2 NHS]|uniref:hypothetical protein n=1 Tax=Fredinandcohnia sp. 179-A 10B2 NHS TaxID=3235176 RepID=UPI00399F2262